MTEFLSTFLIHLILASQTTSPLFSLSPSFTVDMFDAESLEEVFEKTLGNLELARGWLVLLSRQIEGEKAGRLMKSFGVGGREAEVVIMGINVAGVVLRRAI